MKYGTLLIGLLGCAFGTARAGEDVELQATAQRADTRITVKAEERATVIAVSSRFGIDRATLKRRAASWPKTILVRLHLSGLESFRASNDELTVEWSVSTEGRSRVALRQGGMETQLDKTSPYWSEARIIGGNGETPLKEGYFEIGLPARLFDGNPRKIDIQWIDFYRD